VASGLNLDLRQLKAESIPYVLLFLVLAFAAKAALIPCSHYLLKLGWRDSAFCASLANCRGFNTLIVAQIGLKYNLIGPSFFITCILLSLLSTGATGPLAKRFKPPNDPPAASSKHAVAAAALRSTHPPPTPKADLTTPLSPRSALLHAATQRAHSRENSLSGNERKEQGDPAVADASNADHVHIVLPGDSSSDHVEPSPSLSAAVAPPETSREELFHSWLSEQYESNSRVLVVFGEEIRVRLSGVSASLRGASSSGEARFRGDLLVDVLCQWYSCTRAVAVQLGQKLLESGIITPVTHPIFLDKPIWYSAEQVDTFDQQASAIDGSGEAAAAGSPRASS